MLRPQHGLALTLAALAMSSCQSTYHQMRPIDVQPFGTTADGTEVNLYTLTSRSGLIARVTNYGATLVELWTPDRAGELADVVLGFDDVSGYESDSNQYFGCTTGRVANRIAGGRFELDGQDYRLAVNNAPNHLHGGGPRALSRVVWSAEQVPTKSGQSLQLNYTSPDGEEGYPGALMVQVTYTLTNDDELQIEYLALTGTRTPVNLTNHAYWNLSGHGSDTVLDHRLTVYAGHYTPTDDTLIPIGVIEPVSEPLDFQRGKPLRESIHELTETAALGFDHNYVLDSPGGDVALAAELHDPSSGRRMEVWTSEPALQVYSGNYLFGQAGKQGVSYPLRSAVCLEAQHFPDSINQPTFPSIVLEPGAEYRQTTVHRFGTR